MSRIVHRAACAKFNLGLQVLGKRNDGYHEIRTVYQSIALHDLLIFEKAPELSLFCSDPNLSTGADNLVMRAAKALTNFFSLPPQGAGISLTKKIPVQAGLGGGSSDAAATLLGLNELWGLGLSPRDLLPVAERLGSDVPFFLFGGTALGVGRGEEVYPLPDAPSRFIVVIPGEAGMSTQEAYRRIDERLTGAKRENKIVQIIEAAMNGSLSGKDLFNDFEEVQTRNTRWDSILRRYSVPGGNAKVLMAGSGSAWVLLQDEKAEAEKAALSMREHGEGTILTRTLTRHDYWELTQPARE